jgi:hypothetical protein
MADRPYREVRPTYSKPSVTNAAIPLPTIGPPTWTAGHPHLAGCPVQGVDAGGPLGVDVHGLSSSHRDPHLNSQMLGLIPGPDLLSLLPLASNAIDAVRGRQRYGRERADVRPAVPANCAARPGPRHLPLSSTSKAGYRSSSYEHLDQTRACARHKSQTRPSANRDASRILGQASVHLWLPSEIRRRRNEGASSLPPASTRSPAIRWSGDWCRSRAGPNAASGPRGRSRERTHGRRA